MGLGVKDSLQKCAGLFFRPLTVFRLILHNCRSNCCKTIKNCMTCSSKPNNFSLKTKNQILFWALVCLFSTFIIPCIWHSDQRKALSQTTIVFDSALSPTTLVFDSALSGATRSLTLSIFSTCFKIFFFYSGTFLLIIWH